MGMPQILAALNGAKIDKCLHAVPFTFPLGRYIMDHTTQETLHISFINITKENGLVSVHPKVTGLRQVKTPNDPPAKKQADYTIFTAVGI